MRQITLDFSLFTDRAEVHEYLAEKFSFPDHYGKNLDALYDCLTDPMEETKLYLFPAGKPFEAGFLKVIRRAAEENPALSVSEEILP